MTRLGRLILATLGLLLPCETRAAPPPDADPTLHTWFEQQHSVIGQSCCGNGDGHILADDEWRAAGSGYEVRINGAWIRVPPGAQRDPAGGPNPTGHAIVWYRQYGEHLTVYCFAPGTLD